MPEKSSAKLPQKTAIYVRVSTQFQIDKDSLQVQKRELIAYSELVLGIPDYEIFEDPGYSGKNTDRPAYQRMVNQLRSGEYSHLLVWKIDRISRNLLDFAAMYAELKRIGVVFVSKNEQFDTSTAIGEAMLKIILVFAELERQMTAERVTAVMLSRANNGQWNGGKIPFGYDWDKKEKRFTINDEEARIYRRMFDLYEDQQSLLKVCEILNEEGSRSKAGKPWTPVTVRLILTNVFYQGIYRYNVHADQKGIKKKDSSEWISIPDHHPALIDESRFDRISYMLSRNARRFHVPGDTYSRKAVHIFAGLLECGNCSANMTATQDKRRADGWRPSIYGCASRRRKSGSCTNRFINDAAIAPFILAVFSSMLSAKQSKCPIADESDLLKMFLAHKSLSAVTSISGLDSLLDVIRHGNTGIEYKPVFSSDSHDTSSEVNSLTLIIRRNETALQRLKSVYLYGSEAMSEKDYIIERKRIIDETEASRKRLAEISKDTDEISDMEFQDKASYFLMIETLLNFKDDTAIKTIRAIDPETLKRFFNLTIGRVVITDGRITKISFKSGIVLSFKY